MNVLATGYSSWANEESLMHKWTWGKELQKEEYWRKKNADTGDVESQYELADYYYLYADNIVNAKIRYQKVRLQ